MDFLKIRKKARERSAARADGSGGRQGDGLAPPPQRASPRREAGTPAASGDDGAPRRADRGGTDAERLEGALAERLHGSPAAPSDPCFRTWRPGSGEPPPVDLDPAPGAAPAAAPEPRPEDFTVLSGLEGRPAAADGPRAPHGEASASPDERGPRGGEPAADDPLGEFFYREDEEAPEVPLGGAAELAPREDDADVIAREEYLTFLLGGEEYAVAIERVREVLKAPPITEVPRAPAHVLGVVTVRGEVVAVFDPRKRLGLPGPPPAAEAGRVVIVDAGEGACGLLVDGVASVVRLRPGTVEPCPQGLGGASADCLAGIGRQGERLFTVLDLGALLRRTPGPARRGDEGERRAGA